MENEILKINYEADVKEFRKIWLEMFKISLPNIIAFWGIAAFLGLLGFLFTDAKLLFGLTAFVFIAIPVSLVLMNYQSFMKAANLSFASLSKDERQVEITFTRGADGFDSKSGKNFSHIAWESIKSVQELKDSFVFNKSAGTFYIPKSAFRTDSDLKFLRFLISTNVSKNVKLLEQ